MINIFVNIYKLLQNVDIHFIQKSEEVIQFLRKRFVSC